MQASTPLLRTLCMNKFAASTAPLWATHRGGCELPELISDEDLRQQQQPQQNPKAHAATPNRRSAAQTLHQLPPNTPLLPIELRDELFDHLKEHRLLSVTNAKIAVHSGVTTLDFSGYWPLTDDLLGCAVRACEASLTALDAKECVYLTDEGIASALGSASSLRHLDLSRVPSVGSQSLRSIANSGCRLVSLFLAECLAVGDAGLSAVLRSSGDSLEHLGLKNCLGITQRSMQVLYRSCTNLRSLDISHCSHLSEEDIWELAARATSLTDIDLSWCWSISDATIAQLSHHCSALRRLRLDVCRNLYAVQPLTERSSSLEDLSLNFCTDVKLSAVTRVIGECDRLRHVSMMGNTNVDGTLVDAIAKQCAGELLSFKISDCGITEASLRELASKCARLETLVLKGEFMQDGIDAFAAHCTNLTSLDISRTLISDEVLLQSIEENEHAWRSLRHVSVERCEQLTCASVAELCGRAARTLESLHASGNAAGDALMMALTAPYERCYNARRTKTHDKNDDNDDDDDEKEDGRTNPAMRADASSPLRTLRMASSSRVTDASLRALGRWCPNLRVLEVPQCAAITDAGILAVVGASETTTASEGDREENGGNEPSASSPSSSVKSFARPQGCTLLRHLDVSCCWNVTAESLARLLERNKDLEKLAASNMAQQFDLSRLAQAIGAHSLNLQELDLSGCQQKLSDADVAAIVTPPELMTATPTHAGVQGFPFRPLRSLTLRFVCSSLSDDAIVTIGRWCPHLTTLFLTDCSKLTDASLAHIAAAPFGKLLATLCMIGNPRITDVGLMRMTSACRRLQLLRVSGCAGVSADAVRSIRRNTTVVY